MLQTHTDTHTVSIDFFTASHRTATQHGNLRRKEMPLKSERETSH